MAPELSLESLSLPVNPAMEKESVLASNNEECQELVDRLHEIRNGAEKLDTEISFNIHSPFLEEALCTENVGRALVVGSDGCISPCVMKCIPVKGNNLFYSRGNKRAIERFSFGNISDEAFNIIWNKKEYKSFIRKVTRGATAHYCRSCLKCFTLDLQAENIPYRGLPVDFVKA